VNIRDAHIINLCQKVPDVFVRGPSIITVKPQEIRNPKTSGIRYGIEILQVRFLIGPGTALGANPNSRKVLAIYSLTLSMIALSFALSVPSWYMLGVGVLGNKISGTCPCGTLLLIGDMFGSYAMVW
jgi:hypothetical protein